MRPFVSSSPSLQFSSGRKLPYVGRRYALAAVGFHLLVAYWLAAAYFPAQGVSIHKVAISLLLLSAATCFGFEIAAGFKARGAKFDSKTKLLLSLLFGWCLVTIARGITSDVSRLFTLIAHPDVGSLVWLLPFAVFMGRQPSILESLLPVFRFHACIGIALLTWSVIETKLMGVPIKASSASVGLLFLYAAPVMLLGAMGRRADRRIYFLGVLIAIPANFILGNRAAFASSAFLLLLALALGRTRRAGRAWQRVAVMFGTLLVTAWLGGDYVLARLDDDLLLDTRTFLWEEMAADFSPLDWLFGRGALGQYYSSHFAYLRSLGVEGGDWMYRQVNEIGYLHLILKGGVLAAGLYVLVFVRAIQRAKRADQSRFTLGLVLVLAWHVLEMLVIAQATFSPARVLLWMIVGLALSRQHANKELRS